MKDRHSVIPRTLSFIFNGNKVLLMKGSAKKDWEGFYDPVGGHIEKGESVIEAAKREIEEETGLEVDNIKLRGVVHVTGFYGKDVMMFVTSSTTEKEDITNSDEGNLEWINLSDVDSLHVFEDLKPILKHVIEMKSNEMFFGSSVFDGKDKLLSLDIKLS